MARIVICAENYGGPGTGAVAHRLATALSQRGHSVQGKVSLSLSAEEMKGLQADLVIGQHKSIGIASTISSNTNVPFVLVINGEKYSEKMKADLVVFPSAAYIEGYKKELGNTPAVSLENGLDKFCDIVTKLADDSAARKHELAMADYNKQIAAENASSKAVSMHQAAISSTIKPSVPLYMSPAAERLPTKISAAKQKTDPTVSIIVVAQDDEARISQTIQSVLSQAYQEIEVIVVDDGSTDKTGSVVSDVKDPRVMVFRRPWQSGRHAARNLGFVQSIGEFVIFMDAGDSVTGDAVGALLSRIRAASNPGATFGKPSNLNGVNRIRWIFASGKITDADALVVADSIVLYRRAAVDMAGPFKPSASVKSMDAEFIQRVSGSSSIMFVDTPVGSRLQHDRTALVTSEPPTPTP